MIKLGLVGKNISHSLSKEVYEELLKQNIIYELFDIKNVSKLPTLDEVFTTLDGLSITSPYKKNYLDKVQNGNEFLAINCIKKIEDGYVATNTDIVAINQQLDRFLNQSMNSYFFILGDGVMASLVKKEIGLRGLSFEQFSRRINQDFYTRKFKLNIDAEQSILINCCSREFNFKNPINPKIIFWDLNYNHQFHEQHLSKTVEKYLNGKNFLIDQAKAALDFWSIK